MSAPTFKLEHPRPYDYGTRDADFWPTPGWCVSALLESCPPPVDACILEPCAGDGAIVRVLVDAGYTVDAVELREEERERLERSGARHVAIYDFLDMVVCGRSSIVTNPPFSLGLQFADKCLDLIDAGVVGYVALLLRLAVLGSGPWASFWRANRPTGIRPLCRRPSFSGDGKTAPENYAWIIWEHGKQPLDLLPIGGR